MRLCTSLLRHPIRANCRRMDRPWLAVPLTGSAAVSFALNVAPWGIVGCSDHALAISHFSTSINAAARRPRPADPRTATLALQEALDTADPRAVNRALKDCFKAAGSDEEAVGCIREAILSRPLPDPVPSLLLACALAGQQDGAAGESTGLGYPVHHVVKLLHATCTLTIQHAVHALAALPLLSYAGWKEAVHVFHLSPLANHPSTPWPIVSDEHRVAFLHTLVRRGWVKDAAAYASTVEGRAVLCCVRGGEEGAVSGLILQHCQVEKRREANWKGGKRTGVALLSKYREGEDANRGFMVPPDPSVTTFPVRLLLAALLCRGHTSLAMQVVGKEQDMQVELVKAALAGCAQGCNPQASPSPTTACSGSIKLAARLSKSFSLDHATLFPGLYEATIRLAVSGLLWRKDGFPVDVMAGGMWEDSDVGRIVRQSMLEWADRRAGRGGGRGAQASLLPTAGEQGKAVGKEAIQAAGAAALSSFLEAEAEYGRALSLSLSGDAGAQSAVDRAITSFTRAVHSLMTVSDVTAGQAGGVVRGKGGGGSTACLSLPPSLPVLDIKDVASLEQAVQVAHQLGRLAAVAGSKGMRSTAGTAQSLLSMPSLSSLPLFIGLDSEWTPAISSLEGTQVALLQLAVLPSAALERAAELPASAAFTLLGASITPSLGFTLLLDVPALAGEAEACKGAEGWARLNEALTALLAPQAVQKDGGMHDLAAVVLTYGGRTDVSMLHKSYPLLSVFSPAPAPHSKGAKAGGRGKRGVAAEGQGQGGGGEDGSTGMGMGMVAVDLLDLVKASGGRLPAMAGEEEGKVLLLEPSVGGLTSLCLRLLGASLDKTWQTSLWHRRPLLPQQRQYAALDAWVLPQLLGKMRSAVKVATS